MNDKYFRLQSKLTIASYKMDDTTLKNIKDLKQEAQTMIEYNQNVIEKFCNLTVCDSIERGANQ